MEKSKKFYDFIRLATHNQKLAIIEALQQKQKQKQEKEYRDFNKEICSLSKKSRKLEIYNSMKYIFENTLNNIFFLLLPFKFYTTDPLFITPSNFKLLRVFKTCLDLVNCLPVTEKESSICEIGFCSVP